MTAAVRVNGLVKRYGSVTAVGGIDLEVEEGAIFGLVGHNGAGKTTTLRMLATALRPSGGDACVGGYSVRRRPNAVRRVVGYMPDTFGVYDDMRVWEYLDFFARCHGIPSQRRRRIVPDLLDLVDLAPKRDAYAQSLSRGMQQRLCLAHALVHDPQVLLLDEPASGLDPRARTELRELLRALSSMGKTIVISSHILPELEELCTAMAIIDRGRVVAAGTMAELHAHFRLGTVVRVRVLGGPDARDAAAGWLRGQPAVASVGIAPDGGLEAAVSADEETSAGLLSRMTACGHRVAAYAPVASDLEELFFQVTAGGGQAGPPA
jgi:ABC-2 type transport system ATP-binding protein